MKLALVILACYAWLVAAISPADSIVVNNLNRSFQIQNETYVFALIPTFQVFLKSIRTFTSIERIAFHLISLTDTSGSTQSSAPDDLHWHCRLVRWSVPHWCRAVPGRAVNLLRLSRQAAGGTIRATAASQVWREQ